MARNPTLGNEATIRQARRQLGSASIERRLVSEADRLCLGLWSLEADLLDLRFDSRLDLRFSEIGTLFPSAWSSGSLDAHGWRLQELAGPPRRDRRAAREWLDSSPQFSSQPWQELLTVYERHGAAADARWLHWQSARRVTAASPRSTQLARRFYSAFSGYGYYPLLAAIWLLAAASGAVLLG